MKKQLITTFVLLAAGFSCSVEKQENPGTAATGELTIRAMAGQDVKTVLGPRDSQTSTYTVLWSPGDRLNVNGIATSALTEQAAGGNTADFSINGVAAPFHALYPAGIVDSFSEGTFQVTIPAQQQYCEGSFCTGSAILAGRSDTDELALNNVCGVLKLGLHGQCKTVGDITLKSLGAPISGPFSISSADGTAAAAECAGNTIHLAIPEDGIILSESEDSWFHIAIPAGTYPEGFEITVKNKPSGRMTLIWDRNSSEDTSPLAITPGMIVRASAAFETKVNIITDVDSWNSFAMDANAGDYSDWMNEDGEVVVMADIDASQASEELVTVRNWTGKLNGNSHVITKNPSVACRPLFGTVEQGAYVKNLTVDGSVTRMSAFNGWNKPDFDTYASFCYVNFGELNDCVNEADITLSESGLVAGIALYNAGEMTKCVNNGNITMNLALSDVNKWPAIAGVALTNSEGIDDAAVGTDSVVSGNYAGNFTECENNGDIYYSLTTTNAANALATHLFIGGVLGKIDCGSESVYSVVSNCRNTGNITIDSEQDGTYGIGAPFGGIVACVGKYVPGRDTDAKGLQSNGYYAVIDGCTNEGEIRNAFNAYNKSNADSASGTYCNVVLQLFNSTYYSRIVCTGGIVGYCAGLSASSRVQVRNCLNKGDISVATIGGIKSANDAALPGKGHIAGGIIGACRYTDITGCDAVQDFTYYDRFPEKVTAATTGYGLGSYGGIVGGIYTPTNISGCRSFTNIKFWGGTERTCFAVHAGFFAGNASAGSVYTITNSKVGGVGDFYRQTVRKHITLVNGADMSSNANYAIDYTIINSNKTLAPNVKTNLTYWDGTL